MKFKKPVLWIIFCLVTLILICPMVKCNPVLVSYIPIFYPPIYLLLFLININVEFLIIYGFLKEHVDKWSKLAKLILVVNFFTFPTTQLLALFLFNPFILWSGFLIELFPITLECLLFLKLYRDLRIPVTNRTIIISTFIANTTTFLIGLITVYFLIRFFW